MGMRHIVNVMLPTAARGSVGEQQGQDGVQRREVPCSIEALSAVEAEQVHSSWPSVTQKVEMYADPDRQVTPNMFLTGGSLGTRLMSDMSTKPRYLDIVGVVPSQNGAKLTLFCNEAV